MAQRRMVSLRIVDTDAFMDMSLSAQALYLHLLVRADDDGFIANPRKIARMVGSADDDYKMLLHKRFLLQFESGVCVVKHWKIHNLIRSDRYAQTQWIKEFSQLVVDPETSKYRLVKPCNTYVIPNGNQMAPQVRLGKDSITAFSEKKTGTKLETKTPTMKKNSFGRYNENQPADSFEDVVDMDSGEVIKENKPEIKKAYDTILKWSEERRGFKFLNRIKQYSALKKARTAKIKAVDLRQRWKEMEQEEFYKKIGFDWATVVNSFDRKK